MQKNILLKILAALLFGLSVPMAHAVVVYEYDAFALSKVEITDVRNATDASIVKGDWGNYISVNSIPVQASAGNSSGVGQQLFPSRFLYLLQRHKLLMGILGSWLWRGF